MERFSGLEAFVAVVESGSFTDAAAALGVSKSYISKQVSALENRLGAQLLNRTTRSIALTAPGRAFYERSSQILIDLEQAERAVTQLHTEPRGLLRMSVPLSYGVRYVSPAVASFLSQHEDLEIDLDITDRKVDLVDEGFDLVIRIGRLDDSSFAFRKLRSMRFFVCMSPEYIAKYGRPNTPDDLIPEHCFEYAYQSGASLRFEKDGVEKHVRVSGRLRANNGEVLMESCAHGVGVSLAPDFLAAPYIEDGRVVPVLEDWVGDDRRAIWALYPHSRHLSAKVRHFVDFLAEQPEIAQPPAACLAHLESR